jgi:hypothetical protein
LTGAGFGGCVVICGKRGIEDALRAAIPGVIEAEAGDGALEAGHRDESRCGTHESVRHIGTE